MEKIIEVSNLRKSYGSVAAVKGIDFYVEKGKLFAFLGPNGAGKSTTIDTLCTFLAPDSGNVIIQGSKLGKDDNAIRNQIGVVFQDGLLDKLLTVKENLQIRGSFYGLKSSELTAAVERAVEVTSLQEFVDRPYGKLSGGQRRRADIARALINTPHILFLDEPTTGLDPQTRKSVWETIVKLQKDTGMTVFLTTHYMEEAAAADYVIVIDKGEIAAQGTPLQLRERYSNDTLALAYSDKEKVIELVRDSKFSYQETVDTVVVQIPSTLDALPLI